ncbi:MAG: nickel pincer cofactor biosynthesis protein LarC [Methylocystaceae bacterium]
MSSSLYIDPFSGAAGDMLLAGLVDLGVDTNWIIEQLHRLDVGDFTIAFKRMVDRGISGLQLYLSAPSQNQYRHLPQITELIQAAGFSSYVTEKSLQAFNLLADAESKVHGCPPDHIHFHEIGALDSLIDTCGYFLALEKLNHPAVYCGPLPMPGGTIHIAHGEYPLPAPAVTYLLNNFHVCGTSSHQEMVTPTAAALLASSAQSINEWPKLKIKNTGFGAGTPGRGPLPNLLRIIWGETDIDSEQVIIIETQMDDISPEILAYTGELLLKTGALDYYITPIYMKKSRPGFLLTVLTNLEQQESIVNIILSQTSTLGVRIQKCDRQILPRKTDSVNTPYGPVRLKIAYPPGSNPRVAPEYEDCAVLARQYTLPVQEVYQAALITWYQKNK